MSASIPDPAQAQVTLAEVTRRTGQVRRADRQLVWMLLAVVGAYAVAAVVISVGPRHQPAAWIVIAALVVALVAAIVVGVRIRAYSRSAILIYFGTVVAFNLWNAAVTSVSIGTLYWAAGQPTYHFGISEAVGSLPLLIGIWLLWRRTA